MRPSQAPIPQNKAGALLDGAPHDVEPAQEGEAAPFDEFVAQREKPGAEDRELEFPRPDILDWQVHGRAQSGFELRSLGPSQVQHPVVAFAHLGAGPRGRSFVEKFGAGNGCHFLPEAFESR